MNQHRLSKTHRQKLGLLLVMMQKLVTQVRDLGFDSQHLTELEADLRRIGEELETIPPTPPRYQARGPLAELLLLTYELRPRALKAYGEVAEENARYLEQEAARATDLVGRALDEFEGQSNQEVSARAVPEDPRRDRR